MKIIEVAAPSNFNLFCFGDDHEGTILRAKKGFETMCNMMESYYDGIPPARNFGVHHGDHIEAIMLDDPRYDRETVETSIPAEQNRRAMKSYEPIKKHIKAFLTGNHPWKLWKYGNLTAELCERLGIEYGTWTAKIIWKDKRDRLLFKSYHTHGRKSINSAADDPERIESNMNLILKRHLKKKAGDCILQCKGHCFSSDTEILTKSGWKRYNEIIVGSEVLTFNTNTETAEWQPTDDLFVHRNKFESMLEFSNKHINFAVTDGHRVIAKSYVGQKYWSEFFAIDAFRKKQLTVPVSARSDNDDANISDNMVSLLGWLISEGHFRKNGAIQLFQNTDHCQAIESLLDSLSIGYSTYLRRFKGREFSDPRTGVAYKTNHNCNTYYIKIKDAQPILKHINGKHIPEIAHDFSDRQFELFLKTLMAGDGTWNEGKNSGAYYTSDAFLASSLQALCVAHGWRASVSEKQGRPGQYVVNICKTSKKTIFKSHGEWRRVPATGTVWCLSVANGAVFTRRKGQVVVLGNTHKLLRAEPKRQLFMTDNGKEVTQGYTSSSHTDPWIHPDHRWYLNTGSFYRLFADGVSGYAEIAEYDPVELGFMVVKVRDRKIVDVDKVVV